MGVAGDPLMAKPGSDAARELKELGQMSRLAHDLGQGKLPEAYADKMQEQAEGRLGMRCSGCGERIVIGFKFTRIEPVNDEGQPTVDVSTLAACDGRHPICSHCGRSRADYAAAKDAGEEVPLACPHCEKEVPPKQCDFALRAKDGSTCMEPVEFAWLDEEPDEQEAAADERERRAAASG